jgi:hypothetical protein
MGENDMSDEFNTTAASNNDSAPADKAPASAKSSEPDYEVGYRKPPKAHRFKKGQSGNPRGKTKKPQIDDVRIVVDEVLDEPTRMRVGDQVRNVSKLEAMIGAQKMKALQGNPKAFKALLKLAQKANMFSKAKPKRGIIIYAPGTPEEKMILRAFHAERDVRNGAANGDRQAPAATS